jgi:hypothetical protein
MSVDVLAVVLVVAGGGCEDDGNGGLEGDGNGGLEGDTARCFPANLEEAMQCVFVP